MSRRRTTCSFTCGRTTVSSPAPALQHGSFRGRDDRSAARAPAGRARAERRRADAAIRSLALLGGAEKRQLLTEWNATRQAYPSDASLADLIDAQARRTPAACAVSCAGQTLCTTSCARDRISSRIGSSAKGSDRMCSSACPRAIGRFGGRPARHPEGGRRVRAARSSYPRERLQLMLDDSGAPVLLTSVPLQDVVGTQRVKTICIDRDWPEIARESVEAAVVDAGPDRLAYVIYTSGSTGVPKGVEIPHRAVVNFLCSMQKTRASRPTTVCSPSRHVVRYRRPRDLPAACHRRPRRASRPARLRSTPLR